MFQPYLDYFAIILDYSFIQLHLFYVILHRDHTYNDY